MVMLEGYVLIARNGVEEEDRLRTVTDDRIEE